MKGLIRDDYDVAILAGRRGLRNGRLEFDSREKN
jgi:hypothetical protein